MQKIYEELIKLMDQEYKNTFTRPAINDIWILMTKVISYRSTCAKRRQGALIVKDDRIISIGYNGSPPGGLNCIEYSQYGRNQGEEICGKDASGACYQAIHAEVNALAYCIKTGINIEGAKLFCTQSPCINCAKLIVASGIKKVFYLEEAKSHTEGLKFLDEYKIEYYKAELNE